jgi:hypothetical protein
MKVVLGELNFITLYPFFQCLIKFYEAPVFITGSLIMLTLHIMEQIYSHCI